MTQQTTTSKFWIIEKHPCAVTIGYLIDGVKAHTMVCQETSRYVSGLKCEICNRWNCEHVKWVRAQNIALPPAPEVALTEADFDFF